MERSECSRWPKGAVRAAAAGGRALGRVVRGGEAHGAKDGVPHLPAGVHRDAVSDPPRGTQDRLSLAGVEPVAAGLPSGCRSAAAAAPLLIRADLGGAGRKPAATTRLTTKGQAKAGRSHPRDPINDQEIGRREDPCLREPGRCCQLTVWNRACFGPSSITYLDRATTEALRHDRTYLTMPSVVKPHMKHFMQKCRFP
jgi:hypothetical protein